MFVARRGGPTRWGPSIRYELPLRGLSFDVKLDKIVPGRYLLYRILDGFGRGGVFAFDIDSTKPGIS